MEFDTREEEWKKFLQVKSNLAQVFRDEASCKVCLCLELLKIVSCPSQCHSADWNELFENFLEGVLDSSIVNRLSTELNVHTGHIDLSHAVALELDTLKSELAARTAELAILQDASQHPTAEPDTPPEFLHQIGVLETRIKNYDESLTLLQRENEELRYSLRKATLLYEDYLSSSQKSQESFSSTVKSVRDEQQRLRNTVDAISQQVSENALSIETMKKSVFENAKGEIAAAISVLRKEKTEWVKEQNNLQKRLSLNVESLAQKSSESETKLHEALKRLELLSCTNNELEKWQSECLTLSRHSGHLLSAADSVFSAHQQFQEYQQIISEKLSELKTGLDVLKASSEFAQDVQSMRRQMPELKNNVFEEPYHPGQLQFNEAVGMVWSCCNTNNAEGCQRKFWLNH